MKFEGARLNFARSFPRNNCLMLFAVRQSDREHAFLGGASTQLAKLYAHWLNTANVFETLAGRRAENLSPTVADVPPATPTQKWTVPEKINTFPGAFSTCKTSVSSARGPPNRSSSFTEIVQGEDLPSVQSLSLSLLTVGQRGITSSAAQFPWFPLTSFCQNFLPD